MNIVFLTMVKIDSLETGGMLYHDLLRKFLAEGHHVTVITPTERKEGESTKLMDFGAYKILKVKTFNLQKTNVIEKGLGTLAIESQFLKAVKKNLSNIKFDLVLYSTPPITFPNVISYIKNRDGAKSYLLLKDIFPQNAVDMKMIKQGSFLHKMFLKKERKLYAASDTIGCMSTANVNFLLKHNPEISPEKVEVNPNSIQPIERPLSEKKKLEIRKKYGIPPHKNVFLYGGNLGKPQGIDFLLETLAASANLDVFFVIVGSGTEFPKIEKWFTQNKPKNAKLLQGLPKQDYDQLQAACNVGLIFLHRDFTIPNFPSRLLSYLEMKMPVIAATDPNTDIGAVIEEAKCGYKVLAGDQDEMIRKIEMLNKDAGLRQKMGQNGWDLLVQQYDVAISYQLIMDRMTKLR